MGCAKLCDCNDPSINTGIAKCNPIDAPGLKYMFVPLEATDGTKNYIDLTATLNAAYFSAKINHADKTKRFYTMPEVVEMTGGREAPKTKEYTNGSTEFVRRGVRKSKGLFSSETSSPQLSGIIEGLRCNDWGVYEILTDGTIRGKIVDDNTKLYPRRIDAKSVHAIYAETDNDNPTTTEINFNYHVSEDDSCVRFLLKSELSSGVDPRDFSGLLDIYLTVVSCSTTTLVVKLFTEFGTPMKPITDKGLLAADMALYNVTDSAAIPLSGSGFAFAEGTGSSQGTYTITYPSANQPGSADVLRLTPTKTGRDYTQVIATSIVVS